MKTIEIIVSPTGEAKLETKGFAGSSCREASRLLEEALGVRQSDKPTAEHYQQTTSQTTHQQQQAG